MNIKELEAKLKSLLKGEFSSLTISFNDANAPNYCSVKKYFEEYGEEDRFDWVSDEEKQRTLENNSLWTIQWYPNTPVGFRSISASSLEALIEGIDP